MGSFEEFRQQGRCRLGRLVKQLGYRGDKRSVVHERLTVKQIVFVIKTHELRLLKVKMIKV